MFVSPPGMEFGMNFLAEDGMSAVLQATLTKIIGFGITANMHITGNFNGSKNMAKWMDFDVDLLNVILVGKKRLTDHTKDGCPFLQHQVLGNHLGQQIGLRWPYGHLEDADFINSDGAAMNKLLLEAKSKMTPFTGSSRVAEKLTTDLKGHIKLEDAGFDWKILGPNVQM